MTLVPMQPYMFFLAQLLSLVYVFAYVPTLVWRYRAGKVTDEMLAIPKSAFLLIGLCEAAAQLLLMVCSAKLPGIILPILSQLLIFWQLVLSIVLLKRQYVLLQIVGVSLVMLGSVVCGTAVSSSSHGGSASVGYMLLMNVVFMLMSLAFVAKEKIFVDAKRRLGGQNLDLFVVNSFGSAAQFLSTMLLFPLFLKVNQIALPVVPLYLRESLSCFCGTSLDAAFDCSGAPMLPLLYIAANLTLNISGLYLVRTMGAVVTSLAASFIVPATVFVFSFALPYLGPGPGITVPFLLGCATLVIGMLVYSAKDILQLQSPKSSSEPL